MTLEGQTVSESRRLTDEECEEMGIPRDNMGNTHCLVLESGEILIPVSDRAMNHGGGWRGDTDSIETLEGATIDRIAPMSDDYMEYLEWNNNVSEKSVVISFADGRNIYTAGDTEGNMAGCLFVYENGQMEEIVFR